MKSSRHQTLVSREKKEAVPQVKKRIWCDKEKLIYFSVLILHTE
jgi:hypothetical protein